ERPGLRPHLESSAHDCRSGRSRKDRRRPRFRSHSIPLAGSPIVDVTARASSARLLSKVTVKSGFWGIDRKLVSWLVVTHGLGNGDQKRGQGKVAGLAGRHSARNRLPPPSLAERFQRRC